MAYDIHANFAFGKVTVAPSTPTGGTTVSMSNADAAFFPDPGSTPYNIVAWAANQQPLSGNSEVIRITAKGAADSGGVGHTQFTITRLAEQNANSSMTARSIQVGDWIAANLTKKTLTDLETNKVEKSGDTMTGILNFNNTPVNSGLGRIIGLTSQYQATTTLGNTVSLIELDVYNQTTTNQAGVLYGINITSRSDAVDTSAGINLQNNGGSDALHIGVKGNQSLGAQNLPTGIGLDFNKGSGLTEGSNNNLGYGIQVWDWSTTDSGGNAPASLYLNKRLNVDTHHVLALLNANRNAVRITVPQGGAYTGAEPLFDVQGPSSSQRMVITAHGELGVGPNIPTLEIESYNRIGARIPTGNNVAIYFDVSTSGVGKIIAQDGSLANNGRIIAFANTLNLAESARIDSSGNIGIGTNNPGAKLEVQGTIKALGGLYIDTLTAPATPVITNTGTAGTTIYGYKITFVTATGETIGSTEATTTTGNATLNGTNFNKVSFTMPSGKLISKVNIYRTTSNGTPSGTGLIGSTTGNTLFFNDTGLTATTAIPTVNTTGNAGIGVATPTASLHLRAGTASASTAPLKFTAGTNLTTPEAGVIEFDGTSLYFTPSSTRKTIGYADMSNLVPSASFSMNSQKITNLLDPTSAQDAATKAYVDATSTGLDLKGSVRVATTANITLSGTQTIDGVAVIAGDRVLVKDQTTGSQNGIYVVAAGAWSRATDADSNIEVTSGMFTFVTEGTVNVDNGFVLTTNDPITLDTTSLTFTQFSGAGQVIAGTGISKSGNTLTNTGVISLTGTTNQVSVSASTGSITLSLPQNIHSGATPTFAGLSLTGTQTITSASATALTVGANGATNPVLQVDASATSIANGLLIQGSGSGSGLLLSVISSGANDGIIFQSKGTGLISFRPGADAAKAVVFTDSTASANIMVIDSTNTRVGVGKQSPGTTLDVNGTITATGLTLGSGNINSVGTITGTGAASITIASAGNAVPLTLTQNDTTNNPAALTIANAGTGSNISMTSKNIAVGTTTAASIYVLTTDTATIDKGAMISLGGYYDTTTTSIAFASISGRKENSTAANSRGYLQFSLQGTERWRISSSGELIYGGAGISGGTTGRSNYQIAFVTTSGINIGIERHATTNTTGVNLTLQSQGAKSGATNTKAGDVILASGISTGNAVAPMIRFQGSPLSATSGTTDNAVIDKHVINATKVLTNNSAIAITNATLASGSSIGLLIRYAIEVTNGTDYQVEQGSVSIIANNKAGVFSGNTALKFGNQQSLTTGTLTVTFTASGANPSVISVNANSSLTPSTGYPRITYSIENLTQQAIAIQ